MDDNLMDTGAESVQPIGNENPEVNVAEPVIQEPQKALEFEIDGVGKVTPDQIKEWKLGSMRQSDYTKKTQELSQSRKENEQALEVYNYLRNNPQVAQALSQGDTSALQNNPNLASLNPMNKQIEALNYEMANIKLDSEINKLKSQYPDFNEVEVLQEAERYNLTDLELVYNAMQGRKVPTMKEDIAKQVREELSRQLQQNNSSTETIINHTDTQANPKGSLSSTEKMMAEKMGLSEADYLKGKQ